MNRSVRSVTLQIWEDGAWLLTDSRPGKSPLVIASGAPMEERNKRSGAEGYFREEAGPHFMGDDPIRQSRRNAITAAVTSTWIATFLEERKP